MGAGFGEAGDAQWGRGCEERGAFEDLLVFMPSYSTHVTDCQYYFMGIVFEWSSGGAPRRYSKQLCRPYGLVFDAIAMRGRGAGRSIQGAVPRFREPRVSTAFCCSIFRDTGRNSWRCSRR